MKIDLDLEGARGPSKREACSRQPFTSFVRFIRLIARFTRSALPFASSSNEERERATRRAPTCGCLKPLAVSRRLLPRDSSSLRERATEKSITSDPSTGTKSSQPRLDSSQPAGSVTLRFHANNYEDEDGSIASSVDTYQAREREKSDRGQCFKLSHHRVPRVYFLLESSK